MYLIRTTLTHPARVTIFCSALLAAAVAFVLYAAKDTSAPLGSSTFLSVTSEMPLIGTEDLIHDVEDVARNHRVNLAKVMPDYDRDGEGRILYAFIGNKTALTTNFVGMEYPSFVSWFPTKIRQASALENEDLRGYYAVIGDLANTNSMLADFRAIGITATDEPIDSHFILKKGAESPLGLATLVMLAAVVLATCQAVVKQRKTHALQQASGMSYRRIYVSELRHLSFYILITSSCSLVALVAFLGVYNRLQQSRQFLPVAAGAVALDACLVIAIHAVVFALQPRTGIVAAVDGARPLTLLAVTSAALTVVISSIGFSSILHATSTVASLRTQASDVSRWQQAADLVALRFGPSTTPSEFADNTPRFGELYRTQAERGNTLLASSPDGAGEIGSQTSASASDISPTSGNTMIVDTHYLDRQRVIDSSGGLIRDTEVGPSAVELLVPEFLEGATSVLVDTYTEFLEFQASEQSGSSNHIAPQISVRLIQNGQRLFNYAEASLEATVQTDAVIMVTDPGSRVLSDDFYLAAASSHRVLFSDAKALETNIQSLGLQRSIVAIFNPNTSAMRALASLRDEFRVELTSLAATLIVMAFAMSQVTSTYRDSRSQQLFAAWTHGRGLARTHGPFLACLFMTELTVIALIGLQQPVTCLGLFTCAAVLAAGICWSVLQLRQASRSLTGQSVKRY